MRRNVIWCSLLTAILASSAPDGLQQQQHPLIPDSRGQLMSSPKGPLTSSATETGNTVILSDVLGRDRRINIFAGFTRDIAAVSRRFEDRAQNSTILAPVNSAITALPRKPWEDVDQYDALGTEAYSGPAGEERARKNLLRFVEAHIVSTSPWKEGEKAMTLGGEEIWWETKNGVKLVQPGSVEVSSMPGQVYNGEVWILKSVRNFARV